MDGPLPTNLVQEWEKFFAETHPKLERGQRSYAEIFNHPTLFPLQRRAELERMLAQANVSRVDKTILDIGSDKGGGIYHWCMSLEHVKRVIACEVRGTPYSHLFERAFPHIQFLWLPQSSLTVGTVTKVNQWLQSTGDVALDVLFLDGDKSFFDKDWQHYGRLIRRGGYGFIHDVNHGPMQEVFVNLQKKYPTTHIVDTSESCELLKHKANGTLPQNLTPYQNWLLIWRGRSATVGVVHVT